MTESTSTEALLSSLRTEIASANPGDRLPSTRALVDLHRVSPVTVSRAMAVLTGEGLIETRPGAGTFVMRSHRRAVEADVSWQALTLGERGFSADGLSAMFDAPHRGDTISLATGYPHPSLMPTRLLASAWARAARLPDAFDRAPAEGLHSLRAWFARSATPGAGIEPRDVLITDGGQAAVGAAIRAVVPPGEALLVESPTYPGALALARAAGVRPVPISVDADGIQPERLAEAFARTRARAVYLQPMFQNPTGYVLAAERRAGVLEAARQANAFVIEDDYARWLAHGTRPAQPLIDEDQDGHVIYITSLTKATAPSLRIAAVMARGPVMERLKVLRIVDDIFVPRPTQEAALELVTSRGWDHHLRTLAKALETRAEATAAGVRRHLPGLRYGRRPTGGMHLWAALPPGLDDVAVAATARAHGVIVNAGRPFFPAEPPASHLRLTFSAVADTAELEEGLRRLATAVPELATA